MKYLSAVWKLLIWSSENPDKLSRTLKSGAVLAVSLAAVFNLQIEGLPEVVDMAVQAVLVTATAVSGYSTLYYSWKKVKLTLSGENKVLHDPLV